jgi:hypothetical protein
MKKKYANYYDINDVSIGYGKYIDINDYMSGYYNDSWTETKPSETEEERLAREKMEKRNSKIDEILG